MKTVSLYGGERGLDSQPSTANFAVHVLNCLLNYLREPFYHTKECLNGWTVLVMVWKLLLAPKA